MASHIREIRHFHLFCGIGGGALGFNSGRARVGSLYARFRCLGGVDVAPGVITDFSNLVGVQGTVLDLFDRYQYQDFHGQEPPREWREAMPSDIRAAAGGEYPHIVFLSAPCKGFSGLLSQKMSTTKKYRALNRLTLRGVWLMLEAFESDPPELILFENVPRIATRGRSLLDAIGELLRHYGYAVAETTHDCGELGGLAQSRKRFLLVARHRSKVPAFLYEPEKKPLGTVGSVLEKLPLPGMGENPMHRMSALQWRTWVRLAFVKAGSDWRSLKDLAVKDGVLRDFGIVPDAVWQDGAMGVLDWQQNSGVVTAKAAPQSGRFSIADPREFSSSRNDYLGVLQFGETAGAVTGNSRSHSGRFNVADPRGGCFSQGGVQEWEGASGAISGRGYPSNGSYSVADPRLAGMRHHNIFRIVRWDEFSPTVTGGAGPTSGGMSISDPRGPMEGTFGKYAVTRFNDAAGTVIAGSTTGQGAYAVQDPRVGPYRGEHYGVLAWDASSGTVTGSANHDNGRNSVADPRLPSPSENLVCVIRALDGTWHRPFTTLELAALQGFVDPDEEFHLGGASNQTHRERIGNAVPPPAARAIAGVMGKLLLLVWSGETFALGSTPIWVRQAAVAASVEAV